MSAVKWLTRPVSQTAGRVTKKTIDAMMGPRHREPTFVRRLGRLALRLQVLSPKGGQFKFED